VDPHDVGTMTVELIHDDPEMFVKPWRVVFNLFLAPGETGTIQYATAELHFSCILLAPVLAVRLSSTHLFAHASARVP
jgi:hypothetical protein